MYFNEIFKNEIKKMCEVDKTKKNEAFLNHRPPSISEQDPAVYRSIKKRVDDILDGVTQPHESYEEGDQSPLAGREAFVLALEWHSYLDYYPFAYHMSDWCTAVFCGDYYYSLYRVMRDRELLLLRESLLNVSAIFHVVMGAKILLSHSQCDKWKPIQDGCRDVKYENMGDRNTRDHLKLLDFLISLGVDVNAKDVAGCTPLHHCCTHEGKYVSGDVLKMAKTLIKAGANVDAKNRLGYTPLQYCVMNGKVELINLLFDNGADPYIENNDGQSAFYMVGEVPFLSELFLAREKKPIEEERRRLRKAAGGNFRKCVACQGVDKNGNKRCSGNFL